MKTDCEIELKPCPFCGGNAKMIASRPGIEGRICYVARCAVHFCIGGSINIWQTTPERAATVWNRRANCGNAAALRDAVIKALTLLNVCDWPSGVSLDGVGEVMREIDSALDKPPRNCDIYPKRDDAGKAWNKTLDERTRDTVQRYPLTAMDIFIDWLLAYAEPDARGDLCHED